jgi:hypothetical protein
MESAYDAAILVAPLAGHIAGTEDGIAGAADGTEQGNSGLAKDFKIAADRNGRDFAGPFAESQRHAWQTQKLRGGKMGKGLYNTGRRHATDHGGT